MRVLQISKYYSPYKGGIETVVEKVSVSLDSNGIEVTVLCTNVKNSTIHSENRIKVIRTASLIKIFSVEISFDFFKYYKKLKSETDIIHVHLPNPLANIAIYLLRPSVPIVVHWHSDIIKQKFLKIIFSYFESWLLRRCKKIIVTSLEYAYSSKSLRPYLNKVRLIPNCIDDPFDHISIDSIFQKSNIIKKKYFGKRIVFSLGRMTNYKGFQYLILAAKYLPDDVVVLIGGKGELLSNFKSLVLKNNLNHKVHLLGEIVEEELYAYYHAANLFCLPSYKRSEAFGVVLLEAMAFSKPIVACNIEGSGVPWVNLSGVSGLNATPADPIDLAKKINIFLSNNEYANFIAKGARERFESLFTTRALFDSIINVYNELEN